MCITKQHHIKKIKSRKMKTQINIMKHKSSYLCVSDIAVEEVLITIDVVDLMIVVVRTPDHDHVAVHTNAMESIAAADVTVPKQQLDHQTDETFNFNYFILLFRF
uniref:CSON000730 protein n=1 Tax=Culicoides sonorensis TaxID=179676 RepID=A0A336LQ30_CULSO